MRRIGTVIFNFFTKLINEKRQRKSYQPAGTSRPSNRVAYSRCKQIQQRDYTFAARQKLIGGRKVDFKRVDVGGEQWN
jgi:hypothetical protein